MFFFNFTVILIFTIFVIFILIIFALIRLPKYFIPWNVCQNYNNKESSNSKCCYWGHYIKRVGCSRFQSGSCHWYPLIKLWKQKSVVIAEIIFTKTRIDLHAPFIATCPLFMTPRPLRTPSRPEKNIEVKIKDILGHNTTESPCVCNRETSKSSKQNTFNIVLLVTQRTICFIINALDIK